MKPYRIIFMGTPAFAVPVLKALIAGPDEVVAVVCQPDRPKGRGRNLKAPPVKLVAEEAGLPLLQPTKIRTDEFRNTLAGFKPDILVVTAYGRILPGSLLNMPRLGTINVHGSLLPKYRGAAPIQWAVINGETETGVTIMQMDEGMDTGDILLSASLVLGEEDTSASLFPRLAELGTQSLLEALEKLHAGNLPPVSQDESLATEAPMLTKEMGRIDWSQPASTLHSLIRGLDPWPMASTIHAGRRMRLFAPRLVSENSGRVPGTILRADGEGLLVATGRDSLLISEIQPEGRKRLKVRDFLNGTVITPGSRFDDETQR